MSNKNRKWLNEILRCKQNNENIINNITEFKSNQLLFAVLANNKNFSAQ